MVEIGTSLLGHPLVARVLAVACDHLYVRDLDDAEVFVPLAGITWVARREQP